jgi:hypothetical protein
MAFDLRAGVGSIRYCFASWTDSEDGGSYLC